MNNRDRLIDLMLEHKLERRELADLVHVKRQVIDAWLLPPEAHGHEPIPDMAIELLTLKLASRPPAPNGG